MQASCAQLVGRRSIGGAVRRRCFTAFARTGVPAPEDRPDVAGRPRALTSAQYLSKILDARVYEAAIETALTHAPRLSAETGNTVLLKREDTQPVFSFKLRGAFNAMVHLPSEQLRRGVVACSAGNHAQGVAYSAAQLGARATIVMPLATPAIKVDAVRAFGGESTTVKLFGSNYDECAAEAARICSAEGAALLHPFDDPLVIAGQGTIGLELLRQTTATTLDAVFVCTGGGGMLAGIAACIKAVRPSVKVIGVEAEDAAGMTASLRAGKVVSLDRVGLFADGAAVKTVGHETHRLCAELVDDMVTVTTDEICNAIKLGFADTRFVLEPAGALGIAGAKKYLAAHGLRGRTVAAITSGANMDFDRLRFVSERADASETIFAVRVPERPGAFAALYAAVAPRNVTEFSYRYHSADDADIIMSFQPSTSAVSFVDDVAGVAAELRAHGFGVTDLSDNSLAKTHARHLAGGRAPSLPLAADGSPGERLLRFEFPEAPGALGRFLEALAGSSTSNGGTFNVTLFHYRSHGHDIGRVLTGIQVPVDQTAAAFKDDLAPVLAELGYVYTDETDNPVYAQFLA